MACVVRCCVLLFNVALACYCIVFCSCLIVLLYACVGMCLCLFVFAVLRAVMCCVVCCCFLLFDHARVCYCFMTLLLFGLFFVFLCWYDLV